MSIRKAMLPLVLILCLNAATPAYAWFGEGWLESLSGPGPFKGKLLDLRLVCLAAPASASGTAISSTAISSTPPAGEKRPLGWGATFPKRDDARAWFTPLGCHFLDRDRPRLELGIQYGRLHADDNPLDYSHRPTLVALDKQVDLNLLMLTGDVRVNRVVDLGIAFGRGSFHSPAGVFGDFSKTIVQPLRVTLRPLSPLSTRERISEFVSVSVAVTRFNGGFRGEEFGARPGTFNEPGEWVWGWTTQVDVGTLFWGRRRIATP